MEHSMTLITDINVG